MPQRKKIRNLQDLCIDNISRNILFHGEMFKKHRERGNDRIHLLYKTLQYLFSNDLLERLFDLLLRKSVPQNLEALQHVMFSGWDHDSKDCESYLPCLELFFNEHTSLLLPPKRLGLELYKISECVSSLVASKCTNIKKINEEFCFLIYDRISQDIPRFKNLIEVKFGDIDADEGMLKKILETCPLIKYLSARGSTTDLLFLCFCKHHPYQEEFILCPENGKCSNAGKYLEHLHVRLDKTTANGAGIACALQHLPMLKSFYHLPLDPSLYFIYRKFSIDVIKAVLTLQNALIHEKKPLIILKLTVLYFYTDLTPQDLRTVFMSCPHLECIQVNLPMVSPRIFALGSFKNLKELHFFRVTSQNLSSAELRQMLYVKGKEIKTVSLHLNYDKDVDLASINNILHPCINLRRLSIHDVNILDRNYSDITNMPPFIDKLENLFLFASQSTSPFHTPSSYDSYFCHLLCGAKNLRYLTIVTCFAERVFLCAMEKTDFQFLEELDAMCDGAARLPYMKLLEANNSLRKIRFLDKQKNPDVAICKQFVRNNNYDVKIINNISEDEFKY